MRLTETEDQQSASISPDARWVAYDANDSGQFEVYVCGPFFEVKSAKWLVSTGGGTRPLSDDHRGKSCSMCRPQERWFEELKRLVPTDIRRCERSSSFEEKAVSDEIPARCGKAALVGASLSIAKPKGSY